RFVIENLWRTDAPKRVRIVRNVLQIGSDIAVLRPLDQVVGYPEVDIRRTVISVADEVVTAVVPQKDIGMAPVFFKHPLAAVQALPMQTVEAHRVVEAAVVAVHHVREK